MQNLAEMEGSGLVYLLEQEKLAALSRMFQLFKRVKGGHDLMRQILTRHLKTIGRALVMDPEKLKEPIEFMTQLLDMKLKYDG